MSTSAQRQANQNNARLSTGPRTPGGKQASSRNAIRHNLSGTTFVLLPTEDRAAFDALLCDYTNEWRPRTPHETFLVHRMVQSRWRLNRIARMEAELYDTMFERFGDDKTDEGAIIVGDAIQPDHTLRRLHRYAQDAERSYHRAVRELQQYRKTPPPPSEVLEITNANSAPVEKRNEPNPLGRDEIMAIFERRLAGLDALPAETIAELEDLAAGGIH